VKSSASTGSAAFSRNAIVAASAARRSSSSSSSIRWSIATSASSMPSSAYSRGEGSVVVRIAVASSTPRSGRFMMRLSSRWESSTSFSTWMIASTRSARPDSARTTSISGSWPALNRRLGPLELLERHLVLLVAHLERLPVRVQTPVRLGGGRELPDDLEPRLRERDLPVVVGDADLERVGLAPRVPQQVLAERELDVGRVRGVERRERVVVQVAHHRRPQLDLPAGAQRHPKPGREEVRPPAGRLRRQGHRVVGLDRPQQSAKSTASKRPCSSLTRSAAISGEISATRRSRLFSSAAARARSIVSSTGSPVSNDARSSWAGVGSWAESTSSSGSLTTDPDRSRPSTFERRARLTRRS
jgi:hypothetical protein